MTAQKSLRERGLLRAGPAKTKADAPPPEWGDPLPIGRDATPPPFPVDAFPSWVRDFISEAAAAFQTSPDMPGVFALGALAAASRAQLRVRPWGEWKEATNLYLCVAQPPGAMKSPIHTLTTDPISRVEEMRQKQAAPAHAKAQTRRTILEKRLKRLEDVAAKADDAELDAALADADAAREALDAAAPPTLPRILVDDSTPEQLKTLLCEHQSLAMLSPESALFGNIASQRYSRSPNLEAVLAAHPGDRVIVDRRGRSERLEDPRLTVCIAVQPSVLRDAFRNDAARYRGLFDRFLYSIPPPQKEGTFTRDAKGVPDRVRARWDQGVAEIADAFMDTNEPIVVPVSPAALDLFEPWINAHGAEISPSGEWASMVGWAKKIRGHLLRIAGVLHLADVNAGAPDAEISADTMARAIVLMDYFCAHARIAYDVMGDDAAAADARRVLAWIKSRGEATFTRDELTRGFSGRLSADELTPIVEFLDGLGYLRAEPERTGKPGRPRTIYRAHPSIIREPKGITSVTSVDPLYPKNGAPSLLPVVTGVPPVSPHLREPAEVTEVIGSERPTPAKPDTTPADDFADPVPEWAEPADDDEPLSDDDVLADAIAELNGGPNLSPHAWPLAPRDRRQRACTAARELLAGHVDVLRAGGDEARDLLERVAVEAWRRAEVAA